MLAHYITHPQVRIDPARGGLVCASCPGTGPLLDEEGRLALVLAQRTPMESLPSMSPAAARACRVVLQAILLVHLPRALKSVSFIEKLNQAGHG